MSKSPKTKRVTRLEKPPSESKSSKWKDPLGSDWAPGKPSKYKPEYCEQIIVNGHKGKSFEHFAALIGVHIDTLHEWAQKHPEFAEAKRRAKQECLLYWMTVGEKAILGKRLGPKGKSRAVNWPLWIFWMKARFGWREESPEQDDGDVDFDYE